VSIRRPGSGGFTGRAPLVHVKDMAVDGGDPVDVEIGEGNLDWIGILGACRDAGARWLVVEQDNHDATRWKAWRSATPT
jgi:sugar phosphate isomerase/epimerase